MALLAWEVDLGEARAVHEYLHLFRGGHQAVHDSLLEAIKKAAEGQRSDSIKMTEFIAGLRVLAKNSTLMYDVPRRAVEDVLVEHRDAGISFPGRNNGLVISYVDGSSSDIIRLPIEMAITIALNALADKLEKEL